MTVIDAYVADLARALHGPRRAKTDLLSEARDSLIDAAEAHEQRGLSRASAERTAVAEFGEVARIAPGFQRELGCAQSVRTALLVCLVLAPQDILWDFADRPARPGSTAFVTFEGIIGWLGGAAMAGALVLALACGVGVRFLGVRRALTRATGLFAVVVSTVFAACGIFLTALAPAPLFSATGLPMATAVLVLPLAWVAVSGRRCLAAS